MAIPILSWKPSVWKENQEKEKKLDGDGNKCLKKADWCRRQMGEAPAVLENRDTEWGVLEGEFGGWWVTVRGTGGG